MEKSKLTKQMRWEIAERLAEERLNQVNMLCKKVVPRDGIYTRYVKRLLDIVISIIALVITLPINLLIGIGTYFDVGSPIFFKQERVGNLASLNLEICVTQLTNRESYCLLCTE